MCFLLRLPSFIPTVQFKSAPFAHPGATTCSELLSAEDGGIQTEKLHGASGLSVPFGYFMVICFPCNLREREGNRWMLLFNGLSFTSDVYNNNKYAFLAGGGWGVGGWNLSCQPVQETAFRVASAASQELGSDLPANEVGAPRRPLSRRSAVPLIWSATSRELKAVNSSLRWENFEGIARQSSSRWLLFP